jgi:hypothetical protein
LTGTAAEQDELPLAAAERFLTETISSDETYATTAYITRGYIQLIKGAWITKQKQVAEANAVNTAFHKDIATAIEHIHSVEIAGLEKQLSVLSAQGAISIDSPLAMDLLVGIEFYKTVIEALQKNLDDSVRAMKERGIVRTKDMVDMDKLTADIDITTALQELAKSKDLLLSGGETLWGLIKDPDFSNQQYELLAKYTRQLLTKGGILLKTDVFKLEKEKKKWYKTVFTAATGIMFIAVGAWLAGPTAGVFINTLATSLVAKGIGDIISSIMSFATGNPMDLSEYFKSSAISIGIAIVTAGILDFIDTMAGELKVLDGLRGFKTLEDGARVLTESGLAADPLSFITKAALIQASTTAASIVTYDLVGRKLVDQGHVREKATQGFKEILSEYKEALTKIFATDTLNQLYEKLNNIVDKALDRFSSVEHQFATGVPTNVASYFVTGAPAAYGLGKLFQTGANLTEGLI